jgi:hypothetical protein
MYNELQIAKRDLDIKKAAAKQTQNDKQANEELAAAQAHLYQVEERYYQHQVRLNSKIRRENDKMNKQSGIGGGDANKSLQQLEDEGKKRQDVLREIEDLTLANMDEGYEKQRRMILVKYDRQIEDLRAKMATEVGMRELYDKKIEQLEIQKQVKLSEITQKEADDEQKKIDKIQKEREELLRQQERNGKEALRNAVDVVNQEQELRELEIENMQTSEYEKTRLRIKAEKERLTKIFMLNVAAGKQLTAEEIKMYKERMAQLENELMKNERRKDLYDMLGFKLDDDQKDAIDESFAYATEALNTYMQAWQDAANRKVEMADKEVDSAQEALDAERQARAEGYASNVAYAQKELDMAKKNQEKALREQERAQRAQLLMDSIMQASNLVTASTKIWSQLGFPWAIPALAVMWGSFAASKIMAFNATRSGTEQYGEGTVELLQGGSHQSGNDVDLGTKKDGTRRRAEGGEFFAVINKRNSLRFRKEIPDVIHSLNDGTFAAKYMNAYKTADGMTVVETGTSPDLRVLSDDVSAIREQGERRTYTDSRGTHVIYKNVHRIIKN